MSRDRRAVCVRKRNLKKEIKMQNIKFLDLNKQQKTIEKSLKFNLDKVLSESKYVEIAIKRW